MVSFVAPRHLPFGLFIRSGRDGEHCASVRNVAHHAGLRTDSGLITEL